LRDLFASRSLLLTTGVLGLMVFLLPFLGAWQLPRLL